MGLAKVGLGKKTRRRLPRDLNHLAGRGQRGGLVVRPLPDADESRRIR